MSFASSKFAAGACLLLGAVILLCPSDRAISRADSAPEWLSAAGRADLGDFGKGSAAVILGNWTDFNVDATGEFPRQSIDALGKAGLLGLTAAETLGGGGGGLAEAAEGLGVSREAIDDYAEH